MVGRDSSTGIILFAHGSRVDAANAGVHQMARQVQAEGGFAYVCAAFLEMAQPDLAAAITQVAAAGMGAIIIVPYFLTMGRHLQDDLPRLIAGEKSRHPGLEIRVCKPLEGHAGLRSIILDRIRETE